MHDRLSRGYGGNPVVLPMLLLAVAGCSSNEAPDEDLTAIRAPEVVRILSAEQVLAGTHVPTLDPATMRDAEIRRAIGGGPRCVFRYTTRGKPVFAVGLPATVGIGPAVVKLNGALVTLANESEAKSPKDGIEFEVSAEPIRMRVVPEQQVQTRRDGKVERRLANASFEVGNRLKVGYRGYFDCTPAPPTIPHRETSGAH